MLQFTRGDIVIALIDAEFLQPKALRDPQRLRQLPGRVVGDPDIANFPGADQRIQRAQGILQRGARIEPVKVIDIDIIGLQPLQAGLDGIDDMVARRPSAFGLGSVCQRPLVPIITCWRFPFSALPSSSSPWPFL